MDTATANERESAQTPGTEPKIELPIGIEPKKTPNRRPIILGVLGILVVVAAVMAFRFFTFSASHVSTDDATVDGDVVEIAPQLTGNVTKIYVNNNQHVKKGDLLVDLDPSSFQTALAQAQANYDLAVAQQKAAAAGLDLTQVQSNAQVQAAQGVVGQSSGGVASSIADEAKAKSQIAQARATASGATASIYGSQAQLEIAKANKQKALDAVTSAQAQLATAQAATRTAEAGVASAQATAENADKQATRTATLFQQGAISGEVADQAKAAAGVARAQVVGAQQQVVQAQAVEAQRRADLSSARNQIPGANAAVSQAQAMLVNTKDQAYAAQQGIEQSQAALVSAEASVQQAQAKKVQATGQYNQANTAQTQIAVSKANELQADAKVEQALAALQDAKINLARTKIYSPRDGRVSKSTVEVGNLVQPGQAMMAIVPDENPWVTANFKETQLSDVRVGQPVEVDVDALPGKVFKGHVDSISAGTGATFALLPPDNATGNFTKVVQRVSVKILLDPGQPNMDQLRVGMSAVPTISTK